MLNLTDFFFSVILNYETVFFSEYSVHTSLSMCVCIRSRDNSTLMLRIFKAKVLRLHIKL
jgi:hypothetical protein